MTATAFTSMEQSLRQAVALHQSGQLQEAERLYRAVLQTQPKQPEASHGLGVLALQAGYAQASVELFRVALEGNPGQSQYWLSYIDALIRTGQLEAARQMLAQGQQRGLQGEAVQALLRRLAPPEQTIRDRGLGERIKALASLLNAKRHAEAEAMALAMTQSNPVLAYGWKVLGVALRAQGRLVEALAPAQEGARLSPNDAEAHSNLGAIFSDLGRLEEAETSYRKALEISPGYPVAHYNLGVVFQDAGRHEEAIEKYRQALQGKDLGDGLVVDLCNHLGMCLVLLGRLDEAEGSYRRALEINPAASSSYSNLLFVLSHGTTLEPRALFAEHRRFSERYEAPLKAAWPKHGNRPDAERCLQVGIVSGDLRAHAVISFVEPVLEHLGRHASLNLHAYYTYTAQDATTSRIRGHFKHWNVVAGMSEEALAHKIGEDGIDILIDLSGHTAHNRLLSFARKPAPLQVTWMGFPGSTGLDAMDYYFIDRHQLPPGQFDDQFIEKLVYLPAWGAFVAAPEAPAVNVLPALQNGHLTFGSFNRLNKLSQPVIALWAQLLRAVPNARMVLGAVPHGAGQSKVQEWFAQESIASERLSFHPNAGMAAYLALHHQVDICLDTFPYNGGATTCHALTMGVPTLTLVGLTAAGRMGAMLGHVGLQEFVTSNQGEFVQKGVAWAGRLQELAEIRAGLRDRFLQAPIGRPALVAQGVEQALRAMWRNWCAGAAPESFAVDQE